VAGRAAHWVTPQPTPPITQSRRARIVPPTSVVIYINRRVTSDERHAAKPRTTGRRGRRAWSRRIVGLRKGKRARRPHRRRAPRDGLERAEGCQPAPQHCPASEVPMAGTPAANPTPSWHFRRVTGWVDSTPRCRFLSYSRRRVTRTPAADRCGDDGGNGKWCVANWSLLVAALAWLSESAQGQSHGTPHPFIGADTSTRRRDPRLRKSAPKSHQQGDRRKIWTERPSNQRNSVSRPASGTA